MSTPYRDAPREEKPSRPVLPFALAAAVLVGLLALMRGCTGAARSTAEAFLARLGAGDYDGAYDLTSAELRAEVPRAGFEAYLAGSVPGLLATGRSSIDQVFGAHDRLCITASSTGALVRTRADLEHDQYFLVAIEEPTGWRIASVSRARPRACRDVGD